MSGCWEWPGVRQSAGYGRTLGGDYAHRVLYEAAKGPIAPGMQIDHLCRNRICCNPEHLEEVTHRENIDRGVAARTHCKNGHEWTPENVYIRPDTRTRMCRRCHTGRESTTAQDASSHQPSSSTDSASIVST